VEATEVNVVKNVMMTTKVAVGKDVMNVVATSMRAARNEEETTAVQVEDLVVRMRVAVVVVVVAWIMMMEAIAVAKEAAITTRSKISMPSLLADRRAAMNMVKNDHHAAMTMIENHLVDNPTVSNLPVPRTEADVMMVEVSWMQLLLLVLRSNILFKTETITCSLPCLII
jgi:hypothetical protein